MKQLLTDTAARNAKHSGRAIGDKLADGGGLYLLVKAAGKYWRMKYRFAGKEKTLSFGRYPVVSLAKARKARDQARELLADGKDPGDAKREAKAASIAAAANTFEAVAREFHTTKADGWSRFYAQRWIAYLEKDVFPAIGRTPIAQITAPVLLQVLRRIEGRGNVDTAHKAAQIIGQVFRYGIQTGSCNRDPAADLRGALAPLVVTHMSAILEPARVGGLMRAVWEYAGQPATKAALQLSALLFQRPGNIRAMEWEWIDLDGDADNPRRKHEAPYS
jgi:hypothetical protein